MNINSTDKIINVIPMDKFTIPFIEFARKNFPGEYIFVIRDKNRDETLCGSDIFYLQDISRREFILSAKKAKRVLLHCFSLDFILHYVLPAYDLLKKTSWIIWGRDLYVFNDYKKTLKGRVYNFITSHIVKRIDLIAVFASQDIEFARKWLKFKGKAKDILYPSTIKREEIEKIISEKKSHSGINIVIGNSASSTNCHEEALRYLQKYSEEEIKIYAPLSYGDDRYRQDVIDLGKELFEDKFIPITEFMDSYSYVKMLSDMDIAIYNNDRQQATGNIEILSYIGAKVFLKKDYPLWDFYVRRNKLPFFPVCDIAKQSFEEFCFFDEESEKNSHSYFSRIWNEEYLVNLWKQLV